MNDVVDKIVNKENDKLLIYPSSSINYDKISNFRLRRNVKQYHGKFRAQTQSQYMNIPTNNEKREGKAQAEATKQSSHAVVSE